MPAGMAKLSDRRRKPGHVAASVRHQREEEGGQSDREPVDDRELSRQERERQQHDAEQHRERRGVGGLGEEQHRDALDVRDDLPPLGDDTRELREPAVEQHDPGDRLRRGRARVHGDADVGLLDRQRVVDAVARHRDRVAAALQGGDDVLLLRRRDATEHQVLLERLAELVEVGGQLARVEPRRGVHADLARDRRDGLRVVARDDAHGHALLGEELEGLLRVGAHALAEGEQRHGGERRGQALGVGALLRELLGAVGEHERAPAGRREVGGPATQVDRGIRGVDGCREDHLGPAEHPRAGAREADRAPLARRRERDARLGLEHALHRIRIAEAARGRVRLGLRAVPGEHVGPAVGRRRGERVRVVEHDVALGEGARLVEADEVDAGQALDGGQLLHEHLAVRELHGSHRERDARHEHEAQRDHRDDGRDRRDRGILPRVVLDRLGPSRPRRPSARSARAG